MLRTAALSVMVHMVPSMLKRKVSGKIAAVTVVLAGALFPFVWYQMLGSGPLNWRALAILVMYSIAILGFAAMALGKAGPELSASSAYRKFHGICIVLFYRCLVPALVIYILWLSFKIWHMLDAT